MALRYINKLASALELNRVICPKCGALAFEQKRGY